MEGIRDTLSSMESRLNDKIDSAKLSVLRGMHSGDKVAKTLTALVEKIVELEDEYIWKCPECGDECTWNAKHSTDNGTPTCVKCGIDMVADYFHLFDTEEWKAADAMVLRIKEIKASKEERKKK